MINISQVKNQSIYKIIKYILMGMFIFITIKYIPEKVLKTNEICLITLLLIIIFIIIDIISPSLVINISKPHEHTIKNQLS